jgi:hypothetical protein
MLTERIPPDTGQLKGVRITSRLHLSPRGNASYLNITHSLPLLVMVIKHWENFSFINTLSVSEKRFETLKDLTW